LVGTLKSNINKLVKGRSELFKGGAIAFVFRLLGIILLYTLTYLITNIFGAEVYGNYALFVSIVKITALISILGIDTFMLRYVSEHASKNNWSIISYLTQKGHQVIAILASSIAAIFIILNFGFGQQLEIPTNFLLYTALAIIPFSLFRFHNQCFRGKKEIKLFSIFEYTLIPFISICTLLILTQTSVVANSVKPIIAYLTAIFSVAIVGYFLWRNTLQKQIHNTDVAPIKEEEKINFSSIIQRSYPFVLASSSLLLGNWIVQFLIKIMDSSASLGIYDVALKVAQLTMLPLMAINIIAAPKFSEYFGNENFKELKSTAKQATKMVLFLSLPALIFIFIFADHIIAIFGSDFTSGAIVLRILVIGQCINAFTGPVGFLLQMTENQHIFKNLAIVATISNVLICVIFIPKIGLVGAAIASVMFQLIINGGSLLAIKKVLGFSTFPFSK